MRGMEVPGTTEQLSWMIGLMQEYLQRLAWLLLRQQATTGPVLLLAWLPSPRHEGKAMGWISPLQLAQTFACTEHSAPNGAVLNAQ